MEKILSKHDVNFFYLGNGQGLVSKESNSFGNSHVPDIINAGKIIEITLNPTTRIVTKNTEQVTILLEYCSLTN